VLMVAAVQDVAERWLDAADEAVTVWTEASAAAAGLHLTAGRASGWIEPAPGGALYGRM
jgi:hypothetical protein